MHFHTSTPMRSIQLRMKKQSRDLVASAGHFCRSKVCLSTKLRSESLYLWQQRSPHTVYDHLVQGFLACQTKVYLSLHKSECPKVEYLWS